MRISEIKAGAEVLSMVQDQAFVAWVPHDGREIIYGQLQPLPPGQQDEFDPKRLKIRIVTNRGFTLTCSFMEAMSKFRREELSRYDWTHTKPVRIS